LPVKGLFPVLLPAAQGDDIDVVGIVANVGRSDRYALIVRRLCGKLISENSQNILSDDKVL
jgi:hypothetical protein